MFVNICGKLLTIPLREFTIPLINFGIISLIRLVTESLVINVLFPTIGAMKVFTFVATVLLILFMILPAPVLILANELASSTAWLITIPKINIRGTIITKVLSIKIITAEMLSGTCFDNLRWTGYHKNAIKADIQIVPRKG